MPRFRGGIISATESSPTFGMWRMNDVTQAIVENTWGVGAAVVAPAASGTVVEYLVVAGGAGGTGTTGGGGGAGGAIQGKTVVDSSVSYTITVGSGGEGTNGQSSANVDAPGYSGGSGNYSSFKDHIALGGGGGGRYQWEISISRNNVSYYGLRGSGGGSGARQSSGSDVYVGHTLAPGQGHGGGSATGFHTNGTDYPAAGGGGAGGPGANVTTRALSPEGGSGIYSSISGSNTAYAGGGGGAHFSWSTPPTGAPANTQSIGGGGRGGGRAYNSGNTTYYANPGAPNSPAGEAGNINSGSGGGGSPHIGGQTTGGNGGSGIVILSYSTSSTNATSTGSPTYSEANGNRIFTFTGSGTITFN